MNNSAATISKNNDPAGSGIYLLPEARNRSAFSFSMSREWSMPNRQTFKIKPIQRLIEKYLMLQFGGLIIDPFVRNSVFKSHCHLTNDLDPKIKATHNLHAGDFLEKLEGNSVSFMFFDPPYSPRQLKECYEDIGRKFMQTDAQSSFYSSVRDIAKDKILPGGIVISFGWNSSGMGKKRGFEQVEILLVGHGAAINDTICVVEVKK